MSSLGDFTRPLTPSARVGEFFKFLLCVLFRSRFVQQIAIKVVAVEVLRFLMNWHKDSELGVRALWRFIKSAKDAPKYKLKERKITKILTINALISPFLRLDIFHCIYFLVRKFLRDTPLQSVKSLQFF